MSTQPDRNETITTATAHGLKPGDWIDITMADRRWWRRLLFWLLRRGQPQRTVRRRVARVSTTTLET